jgi:serine/threonine-protein kinase
VQERKSLVCKGAERHLAGVWDGAQKAAVRLAFVGSKLPFAEDAYRGLERALDGYASQ